MQFKSRKRKKTRDASKIFKSSAFDGLSELEAISERYCRQATPRGCVFLDRSIFGRAGCGDTDRIPSENCEMQMPPKIAVKIFPLQRFSVFYDLGRNCIYFASGKQTGMDSEIEKCAKAGWPSSWTDAFCWKSIKIFSHRLHGGTEADLSQNCRQHERLINIAKTQRDY